MVKQINISFDDEDYIRLVDIKKDLSWRDFILTLIKEERIDG
jgi:predicted CopG family antitoxin